MRENFTIVIGILALTAAPLLAQKKNTSPASPTKKSAATASKTDQKVDKSADDKKEPERAEKKTRAPLEPICITLEPYSMRTSASQPLPGAKDTVIVPTKETDDGLKRLTKEELAATGLEWETFLTKAKEAAARHLKTLTPKIIAKDKHGQPTAAKFESESELTASIILTEEFRKMFAHTIGERLVVMVPDRHTVYVFRRESGEFQKASREVAETFVDALYPATSEAFEITEGSFKAIGNVGVE